MEGLLLLVDGARQWLFTSAHDLYCTSPTSMDSSKVPIDLTDRQTE